MFTKIKILGCVATILTVSACSSTAPIAHSGGVELNSKNVHYTVFKNNRSKRMIQLVNTTNTTKQCMVIDSNGGKIGVKLDPKESSNWIKSKSTSIKC